MRRAGVVGAERLQGARDVLLGLFRRVGDIHRGDERRVEVVVVELGDAHHLLPQLQVAMERRQVLVDAVDQARVDRLRDVRAVQRGLERRRVVPRPRVENVGLDLRVQRGAERAAIAAERAEERRHHLLPILAVRRRARDAEGRASSLTFLPSPSVTVGYGKSASENTP